jgi:hypothetical protein
MMHAELLEQCCCVGRQYIFQLLMSDEQLSTDRGGLKAQAQ